MLCRSAQDSICPPLNDNVSIVWVLTLAYGAHLNGYYNDCAGLRQTDLRRNGILSITSVSEGRLSGLLCVDARDVCWYCGCIRQADTTHCELVDSYSPWG